MKIPLAPPRLDDLMVKISPKQKLIDVINAQFGAEPNGQYLHWDKLRFLKPPAGYSIEEWWIGVAIARKAVAKASHFFDKSGQPFTYVMAESLQRRLHQIDQQAGAALVSGEQGIINPEARDMYLINSLFEEAITSSQLEGAATTRQVAKEMLRSGRKPRDTGERMIVNNYRAMQFIREVRNHDLTPDLLRELHRIVCDGTMENPDKLGKWRGTEDSIQVYDHRDGTTLHVPPEANELPERVHLLCTFANETEASNGRFLHPVVRAIVLHFMVGYDHPFVDGNGRTARALFYWAMSRRGYWLMEFLSISSVIKKAPSKYAKAFLYTETDGGDLTYFLVHQCDAILKAAGQLRTYIDEKAREQGRVDSLLRAARVELLNHRQTALLAHAIRHPNTIYTIHGHQRSHDITYETARADLVSVAKRELLLQQRRGKRFEFHVPEDLEARLRRLRQ
jgi:Fic family protein